MWWLTRWERRWRKQPVDPKEPTQRVASSNQPTGTISTLPLHRERKMGPF